MSNTALALLQNNTQVSARLKAMLPQESVLGANVGASFGVIGFKGKVWSIKKSGQVTPLMRADGTGPMSHIDVVIVMAAKPVSKIYYPGGYKEGDNSPPDCWSVNGATPDPASKKISPTCAGCPNNAWGSRTTEAGKPGKACADSKRLAVVPAPIQLPDGTLAPAANMRNEAFGGPMLLRIPAASLQGMAQFEADLRQAGFPYNGIVTRLKFDHLQSYPHILFEAVRALTDEELDIMEELQKNPVTDRIINSAVDVVTAEGAAPDAPAPAMSEQAAQTAPTQPVTPAQPTTPVQPAAPPPPPPPVPPQVINQQPAAPKPATNPFAITDDPPAPVATTQPIQQPTPVVAAQPAPVVAQPSDPYQMLPGETPEAFGARMVALAQQKAAASQPKPERARTPPPSPVETAAVMQPAQQVMADTFMPQPSGAGTDALSQLAADLEKLV